MERIKLTYQIEALTSGFKNGIREFVLENVDDLSLNDDVDKATQKFFYSIDVEKNTFIKELLKALNNTKKKAVEDLYT